MVNPSSGRQQTSEQQPRTTVEEVDIVKLMTQIRAKYKAACATLGVRPRLVGATLGGDVVQDSVEERSGGGGVPVKKQVWKFEKAVRMAGPGGLGF